MSICVDCGNKYNKHNVFKVRYQLVGILGSERTENICSRCAGRLDEDWLQILAEESCIRCGYTRCVCPEDYESS